MSELMKKRRGNFVSHVKLVLIVQLVVIVSLASGQKWRSNQLLTDNKPIAYDEQQPIQSNQHDEDPRSGERVDKLASAIGDQLWQERQQQQRDWMQQNLMADSDEMRSISGQYQPMVSSNGHYDRRLLSYLAGSPMIDGGRNYHALVDEFRQSWPSSNPARESRAFRPKLMSTARGFGKRSPGHQTYPDLLLIASPSAPASLDGKMSGSAIR